MTKVGYYETVKQFEHWNLYFLFGFTLFVTSKI